MNATGAALGLFFALASLTQGWQFRGTGGGHTPRRGGRHRAQGCRAPLDSSAHDRRARSRRVDRGVCRRHGGARPHGPRTLLQSLWGGTGSAPVLRGQSQPSTAGDTRVSSSEACTRPSARLSMSLRLMSSASRSYTDHRAPCLAIRRSPAPSITYRAPRPVTSPAASNSAAARTTTGPRPVFYRDHFRERLCSAGWLPVPAMHRVPGSTRRTTTVSGTTRERRSPHRIITAADAAWAGDLSARWSRARASQPPQSSVSGAHYNGRPPPVTGHGAITSDHFPIARSVDLSPSIAGQHE